MGAISLHVLNCRSLRSYIGDPMEINKSIDLYVIPIDIGKIKIVSYAVKEQRVKIRHACPALRRRGGRFFTILDTS